MKLLELILYQSCNYDCFDCPMKKWLYQPDECFADGSKKNAITNKLLLKWIDKYLDPKEWFIEITGGEPGLYPEIKPLIPNLTNRGYKGLIRTNGSQIIPGLPSFRRIAAWHKDKPFPGSYDFILILENPNDDWKEKEQYCKKNNIPHVVFPYTNFGSDWKSSTKYPPKRNKLFTEMTTVFSSGAIGGCFTSAADHAGDLTIQKMAKPELFEIQRCRTCCNIEAVEFFIDNIPGFKDYCGITADMEFDREADLPLREAHAPVNFAVNKDNIVCVSRKKIEYPILIGFNWVSKDRTIVGKLGDNIEELKKHEEDNNEILQINLEE